MAPFIKELMIIIPLFATPITGFVTKAWQAAIHWEAGLKITNNQKANDLITSGLQWATTELKDLTMTGINATDQQLVNEAKKNGTWTPETAVQAFQATLNYVQKNLSAQSSAILKAQLDSVPTYIEGLIEAFVPQAKNYLPSASVKSGSKAAS
jgi:hypothetical protein